jgi:hypothetical protein
MLQTRRRWINQAKSEAANSERRLRRRSISSIIFACRDARQSPLPDRQPSFLTAPETKSARTR